MRLLSLVITAILAATALSVIAIPLVYAQESETEIDLSNNKQKSVVSGQSCSSNYIGSASGITNMPNTACLSG
jgi:hypothetical protein